MKRFFIPFKGNKYEEGICGKKILVVGASFYCSNKECPDFEQCTSTTTKDSSKYKCSCNSLREAPKNALMQRYKPYVNFSKAIQPFIDTCIEGKDNYEEIWAQGEISVDGNIPS